MQTFVSLLAAGMLASQTLANPLPRSASSAGKFEVKQSVPVKGKTGVQKLAAVYAKYGKTAPENVRVAAANGGGTGSVTATPESGDTEYLCSVDVGGQTLNLDFDTGSADLWVFSTELPSSESSGHNLYNPSDSSSAQQLNGETWQISYGDGSGANGNVFADTVTIGGVTVTSQAVEAAQSVSAQFQQDTQNDGLVGLAFSSINTCQPTQQTTFFQTAINEGILSENLFCADLQKGQPGSYQFGYIDSSKYTGDITYTSVDNSQGFWGFTSSGYEVGNNGFNGNSIAGIADTGTTLLLLPDSVVSDYYSNVPGSQNSQSAGGYVFPCSDSIPSFSVGVGNTQFTIPSDYLNLGATDNSGETCFGGLQSSASIGTNIYGDIFLKAIYAVFDSNGPQIGFAAKNTS